MLLCVCAAVERTRNQCEKKQKYNYNNSRQSRQNGKHKQMSLNNFYESDKSELYEWTRDADSFSNAIYLR